MSASAPRPPVFDEGFRDQLAQLLAWRRDVRRFEARPVSEPLIDRLLESAQLSPSVGNSQPWRWVRVESAGKRAEIRANFQCCNEAALSALSGERARRYAGLKLEGLDRAPLQLAVFCDHAVGQGFGLGSRTMPETLDYSTVAMICGFWLAARAEGLGLGWVSILDPARAAASLATPPSWKFIAYLCVGWPAEEHLDPELERWGWQSRTALARRVKTV